MRFEASSTKTTDFFGASTSNDEAFLLPSLNAVYHVSPDTDLRFGLARTLRRPDLRSLSPTVESRSGSAADPDRQGNPDQSPESFWGIDIGIDHYFAENRGFVSLNAFGRLFDDKIEAVTAFDAGTGRFVSTPRNVGDARAYGLELSGRVPLDGMGLANTALWGSALYTDTSVDDPLGGSRRFLDQPDFVGTIGLDYEYLPWNTTFGLALNWTSSINQRQNLAGGGALRQSIDSRARLDLTSRTEIAANTFLSISATNLLGQTEERVDRQFDAGGALQSTTRTKEPTYRTFFVGLTRAF